MLIFGYQLSNRLMRLGDWFPIQSKIFLAVNSNSRAEPAHARPNERAGFERPGPEDIMDSRSVGASSAMMRIGPILKVRKPVD